MNFYEDDRIARPQKSGRGPYVFAAFVVIAMCATAYALIPELRDYTKRLAFTMGDAVGIKLPGDENSDTYKRLGIPRLSATLLASSKISASLERLAREPCDKKAVFAFGEALAAEHEERMAANAYLAFAANCPNGEGEQLRAAQILYQLGDVEKVIAITNELIAGNPSLVPYRYLRGMALAKVKRYPEAAEDYKSTIALQKNPRNTGDWVFVELANIYAAMGRHCDAATAIEDWAAIDPPARDTPNSRKMVEEYSARGCTKTPPANNKKR
jgi:tetratricopeptide (TPR) repeat protein